MRVSLIQTSLRWHNPEANRQHLSNKLACLRNQTDLVLLPEMFTSGFSLEPDSIDGQQPTLDWMLAQASAINSAICGSTVWSSSKGYTNRLLFVTPDGNVTIYDKCHLFSMAGEHKRYQSGEQRVIVELSGWRFLLTVCYDLRFPVFCRNRNDYDAMICVANWPDSRRHAWRTLLMARAIENQAYVLGVNRVGEDGNGLSYSGDSMVVDFIGDRLIDGPTGQTWEQTQTLDYEALCDYRRKFPVWKDADHFVMQ